jgi:hypothetical protein
MEDLSIEPKLQVIPFLRDVAFVLWVKICCAFGLKMFA